MADSNVTNQREAKQIIPQFMILSISMTLTFTALWDNSPDDKLLIFFTLPRKQDSNFVQIVCIGECHILFSGKNKRPISKCLPKFYPEC